MQSCSVRFNFCNFVDATKAISVGNKVVKPHNGPLAVLVLIADDDHHVEDATGFYAFGINGSLVSNWL